MPVTKQGEVTTVTVSPEAERQMIEFEREMIKQNQPIIQHGAAMLEEQEQEQEQRQPALKITSAATSPLEIYRYMKRIAGVQDISIPSAVEFHSASSADKSVTSKQDNTNLVLRNLMKKICSATGPTLL
jgi:hypothetical protein